MEKLLYRVEEVCILTGLGRSKLYEEIKQGRIGVVHFGKSIRIPADELRAYVERAKADARLRIETDRQAEASLSTVVCSACGEDFDWRQAGLQRHPKRGQRTFCASCRNRNGTIRTIGA